MIDAIELMGTVFSGLSALVIEDAGDDDGAICVQARTRDEAVACPRCGTATVRVHGYHERTAADVPADGRRVLVKVRVRRMRCPVPGCKVQTFREQVPGVLDRYQRRTSRLARQVSAVARELAGRAGARLLPALGICASRHTLVRVLLRIPLPAVAVPRVLGIDDFALCRSHAYATVLIDAETGRRVDVLPGRTADVVEAWLRGHPGVQVVCRDGSGAYGEAVRRALPGAVQVSDRWHLWHGLAEAVQREVAAHSACWAQAGPSQAASAPRRSWSAGSRSTTCSAKAPACGNAPAAWTCPSRRSGGTHAQTSPSGCSGLRSTGPAHRPVPRPPAQTPRRRTRGNGPATAPRDPRTRLPGQPDPARPVPLPGAGRG